MSKTLTLFRVKINRLVVAFLCVILICSLIMVGIGVTKSNKRAEKYSQKSFYIVYADKVNSTSLATEKCAQVADQGGAGVVYAIGKTQFIVANVYLDYTSAKTVCSQICEIYPSANILEIIAPNMKKSLALELDSISSCKHYYEFCYLLCDELYNLALEIDKGNIVASDCYKKLMGIKKTCQDYCSVFVSSDDKISLAMYDNLLINIDLLDSFFNSAFVANIIARPMKKLYTSWVFGFVDMCQQLKNL